MVSEKINLSREFFLCLKVKANDAHHNDREEQLVLEFLSAGQLFQLVQCVQRVQPEFRYKIKMIALNASVGKRKFYLAWLYSSPYFATNLAASLLQNVMKKIFLCSFSKGRENHFSPSKDREDQRIAKIGST